MPRLFRRVSKKAALPPGTLVHTGERKAERVRIRVLDYDDTQLQEREATTVEELAPLKDTPTVTWVSVDGLHDVRLIERIGKVFDLHPLVLEDIVNTMQRPKMEDFGGYIFVVLRMLFYDEASEQVVSEQVSLVLGRNFVLSFQEGERDVFEPIRERARSGKGRMRKAGADYLAYAVMDAIVDNYFLILEKLGERVESLEERLVTEPRPETLQTIHEVKRELAYMRKSVWPVREMVAALERGESSLVHKSTAIYLRDVYDHTIQVIDSTETLRDVVTGMLDVYLSSVSNRTNEAMKVLAIIATIFIPLTFLAGLYGMNFQYMPELRWHWGYYAALSAMAAVAASMVIHFKRKRWM